MITPTPAPTETKTMTTTYTIREPGQTAWATDIATRAAADRTLLEAIARGLTRSVIYEERDGETIDPREDALTLPAPD